ncbi:branched-chain alpha-keto acid dehydrogenase subunit E2 [Lactiplantibacillus plantarum]|uniref:2-oxo acid dehydrogenase subunit E2 n=1 Tax=Lactiplantibacillus plantarum TaxID=1590 RepID=UPI0007BC78B3|nr:2-oxo acid dehydrogenase subunit E2 [Lactiplantibacillus plantarum]AYE58049.1 branched-chain alpha-keto acid dehydrogenase subunit E2 [Lactiplantibacillus plantarum]KZU53363.1 Dihydrolipoamide acetyltransferase component ofpyruvate dehydrogenase complex [Lactiplantibacillus plantarum]QBJ55732.1 branched-chain alpha-keto acid dehydrogenase subunit E2 [Lactiplantibacillus plantarum]
MAYEFKLPELGEGLEEGEIASWLVKPGDEVKEDDSLVEIQNDKSVEELPSPVIGKVIDILVPEGETAKIGDVIVTIDDGSGDAVPAAKAETPAATKTEAPASEAAETPAATSAQPTGTPAAGNPNKRVLAMPSVRQYARDKDIDITLVTPTGAHGQITKQDIDNYTGAKPAATPATTAPAASEAPAPTPVKPYVSDTPELETREKMTPIRKAISKAMVNSKHTAPHVTLFDEVEVSALMAHRKKYKQVALDCDIHLTFLPYFVKALVAVLQQFPELNASIDDANKEIVYKHYFNIGVATDTDRGLLVPNIKHAEGKGLFAIAKEITDNTQKAYDGKLKASEMSGGSITISNIGSIGGGWFTPVINQPEVAILGVGRIGKEPYVNDDGEIVVGKMQKLSLSFDHRLIDGATAQRAMNLLKQLLHDPELLLMEG